MRREEEKWREAKRKAEESREEEKEAGICTCKMTWF